MRRSPDGPALHVEAVVTTAGLEALQPEWRTLWARVPDATPFQSPDWLVPWWRHVGEGTLLSFAFRAAPDDALVGVAPFYVFKQADGRRVLFPLGIATTDYLDATVAPEHRAPALALLFDALALHAKEFDGCEWPQLRAGATLLGGDAPAGWSDTLGDAEPCPVLSLPRRLADLGEHVPAEMLGSFNRRRERAGKHGRLSWERGDEHDAAAWLEAHLRLHGARWRKRGEAGVLAADAVQAAQRDSLPGLQRSGALRLYAMRLDGRIIATLHALADPAERSERRVYFYLGGFDPAFERLSPGMLVVGHAIEEAVREGAAAVDFLRGGEAHKYRWGARDAATWRRSLQPPAASRA